MSTFDIEIAVRSRDIGAMGHVNNAVYLTYFEEGRRFFFKKVLDIAGPMDYPYIVAHIGCDYVKPVGIHQQLIQKMWIDDIGSKSFTIAYELADKLDETEIYARGRSILVCYDYERNCSIAVSNELREKLAAYRKS